MCTTQPLPVYYSQYYHYMEFIYVCWRSFTIIELKNGSRPKGDFSILGWRGHGPLAPPPGSALDFNKMARPESSVSERT